MKKRVLIAVLLVLVLAAVAVGVARAAVYGVHFRSAYESYVVLQYIDGCSTGCWGGPGYPTFLSYGDSRADCPTSGHARDLGNITSTPRIVQWGDDHPEPGDTACAFWCCNFPPWFHTWSYFEVQGDPGTW